MGIKEFRERLGEVARGDEPVLLTDRGEVIGTYSPIRRSRMSAEEIQRWATEQEVRRDAWRDRTPNWRELLRDIGIDPDAD